MNKQRKVLITTTYNEIGVIIDTKAEEVTQPNLQPTCNNLATDTISRQETTDAIDERFKRRLTERGYSSFEEADDKTKLFLDGIMEALDVVLGMEEVPPMVDSTEVTPRWPKTYLCDPRKNVRCPKGITCFMNGGPCQETTREEYATDPATQAELMGYVIAEDK